MKIVISTNKKTKRKAIFLSRKVFYNENTYKELY